MIAPFKSLGKTLLPLLAGAFTLAAAPTTKATLLIDESFTGPAGVMPSDWLNLDSSGNRVNIVERNGKTSLEMNRWSGGAYQTHAVYYQGTGADNSLPDSKLADFRASVILNTGNTVTGAGGTPVTPKGNVSLGMLVRSQTLTYDTNSATQNYYVGIMPVGSAGTPRGLYIWSNVERHTEGLYNVLEFAAFDAFTEETEVMLQVNAIGSTIEASLWTLDADDKALIQLASVSINNASTDGGYLGLRSSFQNTSAFVGFRNLEVHAIPEPATALLLLPAAAFLVCRKRRTGIRS